VKQEIEGHDMMNCLSYLRCFPSVWPRCKLVHSVKRSVCVLVGLGAVVVQLFSNGGAVSAQSEASVYNVGIARVDITPDYPVRQNGFLSRKQESEGVRQRIWAKAIAIGSIDAKFPPAIMITVDNLGIPDAITQEISQSLKQHSNLPLANLSIAASHTHTAPMIHGCAPNIFGMPIPAADQTHIDRYTREFTEKLIAVAKQALDSLKPSTLHFEIGSVGFAKNRRSATGPIDHDLPILVVKELNGQIRAIHANYACHCVTLSENRIGGDWAGYAQQHIEQSYPGATALISIGCGADQNPIPGVMGDRFDIASQQGMDIANEVKRVLAGPLRNISGPLTVRYDRIDLDLAAHPTRAQFEETGKLDTPVGYHARVQLQKIDRGEPLPSKIDYPVQTWTFGESLAMVFLAGEVVVDYAKRLKSEIDSQRLWLCAYSNACPCYIPSERVLKEGGYEGASAMVYYDQPSRFAPGLESKIISTVKAQLSDAFAPDAEPGKTLGTFPMSPAQSLKSIRVPEGLQAELVASEPLIASPVAVNFGHDGRVWVAEMYDYPTGLDGRFQPGGRVRVLESSKRDGTLDKSSVFLDSIPFPTGVTPWRKGVLVCAAPDILYAEDTDGDLRADVVKKLYSGFGTDNFQARVNSLEFGLDGWLHGSCGLFGGTIQAQGLLKGFDTIHEYKLGDRDFRIQPDLGLIEAVTGRTQQGRIRDDWGNWFGCSNSSYGFHLPLEESYLSRNPFLTPPPRLSSLPADAEANKVYPATDKVQLFSLSGTGGQATAACGIGTYRDTQLGSEYSDSVFTCESVNLVVHRLKLKPNQSTFQGMRGKDERESEFLGSTDTWFRPVQARTSPDGSLWIVDMYRFVIEHPHWIPEVDLEKLDVRAGHSLGRIYRVRSKNGELAKWPRLDLLDAAGLVAALDSSNGWQRDMAMQTLLWNEDTSAIPLLRTLLRSCDRPESRLHAICTLELLKGTDDDDLLIALMDKHPGVRRHAVRISDRLAARTGQPNANILAKIIELANDDDAQVRLQVACSLGNWQDPAATTAMVDLAMKYQGDLFLVSAVLSGLNRSNVPLFVDTLLDRSKSSSNSTALIKRMIPSATAMGNEATISTLVAWVSVTKQDDASDVNWLLVASLLESLEKSPSVGSATSSRESNETLNSLLDKARLLSLNHQVNESVRLKAIDALTRRKIDSESDFGVLKDLLTPKNSAPLQMAAATAIARASNERAAKEILAGWRSYSPATKSHVLDILLGRDAWISILLEAMESGMIGAADLNAMRRQRLLAHANAEIVTRSESLLAGKVNSDRKIVIDEYRGSLKLPGNAENGKSLFGKNCATCHRLGDLGYAVGPDLTAVASKSHEFLIQEIFDPNRNLDNRYVAYQAITDSGRSVGGLLLTETQASVTLRGPEAKDEALVRSELEEFASNRLSLMPEGLEKVLSKQDIADLLSYLDTWRGNRKSFPGNNPVTVRPLPQVAVLSAQVAEIFGTEIAFEEQYKNIGTWRAKDDYVVWNVDFPKDGKFDVWLDWACEVDSAGNSFVLECGDQRLSGIVESTITWANYLQKKLGTFQLHSGVQRFTMRPGSEELKGALLDLRAIYLVPEGQPLRMIAMQQATGTPAEKGPQKETLELKEVAARILDDTQPKELRMELIKANVDRAAELVMALTKDLPFNEAEEYRRIPWIWNVAIAAGKQNDTQVLRELLRATLPLAGQPLRDWQSVVIGGGVINGLSLSGHWPRTRVKEVMKNETDLMIRWARCIELSAKMADDEKIRKGTRYDALRIIPMDPTQVHLDQLRKYLSPTVDAELQMGAVSGLSDVELAVVATWFKEKMADLKPGNRRLAIEALGRNDDRLAVLLDLIQTGAIQREEVLEAVQDKLRLTKNPVLRPRVEAIFNQEQSKASPKNP
jgi:putative membrane-bound dehydrogenase-like protein